MSKPTIEAEASRKFLTDFLGQPPVEPKPRSGEAPTPTEEPQDSKEAPEEKSSPAPSTPKPEAKVEKKQPEKQSAPAKEVRKKSKEKAPEPTPTPEPEEPEATLDVGELVDRTARAVAREVRDSQRSDPKPEYRIVEPEIPAEERKLQSHLSELEKLYPGSYSKITDQRKKFVEKLRSYEEKWLAEHPGEDFNPDAEEHNDFYAADPLNNVSQEHLAEAIAESKVRERMAQLEGQIEASERRREVEPRAAGEAARVARSVVDSIDKDVFGTLVRPDGTIDTAAAQAAEEADPVRAPIVIHAATEAARMSGEMVKLYNGVVRPDPVSNPLHAQLLNFGQEVERRMLSAKSSQWKDPRGRSHGAFLPSDEYWSLPEAQRRKHWTFDAEDMAGFIAQEIQKDAKSLIEREEKRFTTAAKKRGFGMVAGEKKPANGAESNGSGDESDQDGSEESDEKPNSPSGRGAPNMAGPKGGTLKTKESAQKSWLDGFLGKT